MREVCVLLVRVNPALGPCLITCRCVTVVVAAAATMGVVRGLRGVERGLRGVLWLRPVQTETMKLVLQYLAEVSDRAQQRSTTERTESLEQQVRGELFPLRQCDGPLCPGGAVHRRSCLGRHSHSRHHLASVVPPSCLPHRS